MIRTKQPNPARAAAEANTESRGLVETRAHRRAVRNTSPADDIRDVDVCRPGTIRDCQKMQTEYERETYSDVARCHVSSHIVSQGSGFKGRVSPPTGASTSRYIVHHQVILVNRRAAPTQNASTAKMGLPLTPNIDFCSTGFSIGFENNAL